MKDSLHLELFILHFIPSPNEAEKAGTKMKMYAYVAVSKEQRDIIHLFFSRKDS